MNKAIQNTYDWGIRCVNLSTNGLLNTDPIMKFSFKWENRKPDLVSIYKGTNTGRISGVGQYDFVSYYTNNQAFIQNAFKSQQILDIVEFVRFANFGGEWQEIAKYTAQSCIIANYSFSYEHTDSESASEVFKISIHSIGNNQYTQIIRENGVVCGNVITNPYNASGY